MFQLHWGDDVEHTVVHSRGQKREAGAAMASPRPLKRQNVGSGGGGGGAGGGAGAGAGVVGVGGGGGTIDGDADKVAYNSATLTTAGVGGTIDRDADKAAYNAGSGGRTPKKRSAPSERRSVRVAPSSRTECIMANSASPQTSSALG